MTYTDLPIFEECPEWLVGCPDIPDIDPVLRVTTYYGPAKIQQDDEFWYLVDDSGARVTMCIHTSHCSEPVCGPLWTPGHIPVSTLLLTVADGQRNMEDSK